MLVKIFFCYAHKDEELLDKLRMHLSPLQREGLIDDWYDRNISAGTEWEKEIDINLNKAQIILMLVSPDFIASDYCYSIEMVQALERHERKEVRVIPVILRYVHWQLSPLRKLQAVPTDGKPVKSWQDEDAAFFDVVKFVRKVVEEVMESSLPSSLVSATTTSPVNLPDKFIFTQVKPQLINSKLETSKDLSIDIIEFRLFKKNHEIRFIFDCRGFGAKCIFYLDGSEIVRKDYNWWEFNWLGDLGRWIKLEHAFVIENIPCSLQFKGNNFNKSELRIMINNELFHKR